MTNTALYNIPSCLLSRRDPYPFLASLKLKHVKLEEELIEQLAEEVNTKFSKTIYTYFFPVSEDIKQIVSDWVNYLYKEKLFNSTDPLFPRTKLALDSNNSFIAQGIEPIHWKTANQIRKIFKDSFENANIEYFSPHSFRHTLSMLGKKECLSITESAIWSKNFGHERLDTTFCVYGTIDTQAQGEIMRNFTTRKNKTDPIADLTAKVDLLLKNNIDNNNKTL